MSEERFVNIVGLLEGRPTLPRLTLWDPTEFDADGTSVVEPLMLPDVGRDFLLAYPEAQVSFENGLNLAWCMTTDLRGRFVRRTIRVTLPKADPRFRLVSNTTHQVVAHLEFGQAIARAHYDAAPSEPGKFAWWLV